MSHRFIFVFTLAAALFISAASRTLADPPASAPSTDGANAGIDHLRDALKAAYNSSDTDAMLRYIHPDAVIIFPDGQILKGREELRKYYERMIKAPGHIVASYTAEPIVQSRTIHGDVALSYGLMNDHYVLTDGKQFDLNSRFSVTVFKSSEGQSDTDGWMIRSFHSSSDVFDNAILKMAIRKVFYIAGGGGLLIGGIATWILLKLFRRRSPAPQEP